MLEKNLRKGTYVTLEFQTLLKQAEKKMGYTFKNSALLAQALTHRSFSKVKTNKHEIDNERLEFFGDAVLKLIVSEYLYILHPEEDEGFLTKSRAKIISDKCLAQLASQLDIGSYMRFSFGEKRSGGDTRASNLADAFEAILGAIFLDSGFLKSKAFFLKQYTLFLDNNVEIDLTDYKTTLQEVMQKKKCILPHYDVSKSEGPDHNKLFHVKVTLEINDTKITQTGKGLSKKEAQQQAAKKILATL